MRPQAWGLVLLGSLLFAVPAAASWQINTVATETDYTYDLVVGNGRNDGVDRVYAASRADSMFEYTYSAGTWNRVAFGRTFGTELNYPGVALGPITDLPFGNVTGLSLITGNENNSVYAFTFNGSSFYETSVPLPDYGWKTAIGRGRNTTVSYAYVACDDTNVYEARYNGSAWNSPTTVGTVGGTAAYAVAVGPGRNGDATNYVFGAGTYSRLYEFRYNGAPYVRTEITNTGGQINDIKIGTARNGSSDVCVYSGNTNGQVWESFYNGASWQSNSITASSIGVVYALAVGDGRNDGVTRLYAATANNAVYELTWNGVCWSPPVSCGSPSASDIRSLALGPGRDTSANFLYAGSADFSLYEYEWIAPTATTTSTVSPTATLSPTPTASASSTATPIGTATATPTSTATLSATPTPSATPTLSSTLTTSRTPTPTATPTPTFTPTPTVSSTATASRTFTPTPTVTPTRTITLTRTVSPTVTVSATDTPTAPATATKTATPVIPLAWPDEVAVFPNPGRDLVRFAVRLDQPAPVKVWVYNLAGERVAVVQADLPVGPGQTLVWDCRDVSPGIYLARTFVGGREVKKVKLAINR